jgi:2-methylcitrate dehydratase
MDSISARVADYVAAFEPGSLSPGAVHETKRRLVDSLACALGAIDSPPAVVARELGADAGGGRFAATAIGLAEPTTVELAAFANAIMVRYLDFNDMALTARGGGGHPSDLIATSLAVGEAIGATGLDVLSSIAVGYEVNSALASAVWLREKGWDQGLNVVAAASMMAGRLLGLDREQLAHALALAVTPNVPVRQTRVGHLSMWKGAATAGAVRNGIFAARLAQKGMTGPPKPYEGPSGIFDQVTGTFEVELPVRTDRLVVEGVATKTRPAEYNAQGPLDLILAARDDVTVEAIEAIELETYHLAVHEIGSDPAKWDPRTRETADHSLPYLLAVALVDGRIDVDSFAAERVVDPALRPVMAKIRIVERPEYTAEFPARIRSRLAIHLTDGRVLERETAYPRGHFENPIDDAELTAKYRALADRLDAADRSIAGELLDRLWSFDTATAIGPVMAPLARMSGRRAVLSAGVAHG